MGEVARRLHFKSHCQTLLPFCVLTGTGTGFFSPPMKQDKFESQAKPKFMKREHILLELKRKTPQAVSLSSCPEEGNRGGKEKKPFELVQGSDTQQQAALETEHRSPKYQEKAYLGSGQTNSTTETGKAVISELGRGRTSSS